MSRAERRRRATETPKTGASRRRPGAPVWILSGAVISGLVVVGIVAEMGRAHRHPEARLSPGDAPLMPPERYGADTRTSRAYQAAWTIPTVIDALYCYCRCEEHSDHRSLLDCFASDHAAACDICMREAEIAYRMAMEGETLGRIRAEIDAYYLRG